MRTLLWFLVLLIGFGLMFFSYWHCQRIADPAPLTEAVMFVGHGEPAADIAGLPIDPALVRLLPLPEDSHALFQALEKADPGTARAFGQALQERLILYPRFRQEVGEEMLSSGRLPVPGDDEIVAGCQGAHTDQVNAWGRSLRVVGVLNRSVALFADAYVAAPDCGAADLFGAGEAGVQRAYILRMPRSEMYRPEVRERLAKAFPLTGFDRVVGSPRASAGAYFLYLGGLALMLTGGSALLIRLYLYLAGAIGAHWLAAPFRAIRAWPRLFAALHVACFGTIVAAAALAYAVPQIQALLTAAVQQSIASGSGPLGVAGSAYLSGNILWAALVTVSVNFFLGSLLVITCPSVVLPGVGALLLAPRSMLLGLVLAPSGADLARMMLPHSFVILVEMEAYIFAGFFALMIPIYIFRRAEGPTWYGRYGRALLLNLEANLVVLFILIIVAFYEATEVILQIR